tara:strand:+ start:939 stop:1829 length:891 start_codon:yes stop_codon:yes gene_type:complete
MSPLFVGPANSTNKILGNLSADPSSGNAEGDMYFNTTENKLKTYNGSAWETVSETSVVTNGLVSWFDPRRFGSLSNGSTATPNPAGSSNATYKLYTDGTASFVSGTNNQAIEASGNDKVAFWTEGTDVTAMDNVANYTMELWVYVGSQDINNWGYLIGKSSFWAVNDAGIHIHVDGDKWGAHSSTNPQSVADIQANGWHHIVYVRNLADANCRKFYVDNSVYIQDNTGDNSSDHVLNNNCALTVGGSSAGNSSSFSNPNYSAGNGFKYGHARFYNTALSAADITQNWNAERSIYGL